MSNTARIEFLNTLREKIWKYKQTSLTRIYKYTKTTVERRPIRDVPTRLRQLHLDRFARLVAPRVYTHKQFLNKHKPIRRHIVRSMADLDEFTHNAQVETLDNPPVTPVQDEPLSPTQSVSSDSESSVDEVQKLQQEIDSLKAQIESNKPPKRKRPATKFLPPPPPPIRHPCTSEETDQLGVPAPPKPQTRTVLTLLQHLMTIVTIRMDDYATAYQAYKDLEDSKCPMVVLRTVAELLTHWNQGITTEPGTSCLLGYLIRNLSGTLSTRCLGSTTWAHLLKYFQRCGTPGASGHVTTQASSASVYTTTTMYPITMSSTTVRGQTIPVSVEGSRDGEAGPKRVRRVDPACYIPRTFEDLQSTSAREGDDIYISKSTGQIGGTIVKLEIYRCEDVQALDRVDWWRYAQFRGTIMTDRQTTLETAIHLQDLMETELEERPGTRFIKSRVPSDEKTQSRGRWRK